MNCFQCEYLLRGNLVNHLGSSSFQSFTRERVAKWVLVIAGSFLVFIGFAVVIGWFFGRPNLFFADNPSTASMQFNAALIQVLEGSAFFCLAYGGQRCCRWMAVVIILFCFTVAWQSFLGINFHVDELFYKYDLIKQMKHPGRMALNSAVSLCLGGIAVFVLSYQRKRGAVLCAALCSALISSIALLSFTGYLTGLEDAIGWSDFSKMAFLTSISCLIIGVALLSYIGILFWDSSKGVLALPISAAAVIMTGNLTAFQVLKTEQFKRIEELTRRDGRLLIRIIEEKIIGEVFDLSRFAQRWDVLGGYTARLWDIDAGNYIKDLMGLKSMRAYDENFKLIFEKSAEPRNLLPLSKSLNNEMLGRLKNGDLVFAVSDNQEEVMIYTPLIVDYTFKGVLVSNINLVTILKENAAALGYGNYLISLYFQDVLLHSWGDRLSPVLGAPIEFKFDQKYLPWKLVFYITASSVLQNISPFEKIIPSIGLMISILLGVLIYFGQGFAIRKRDLQKLNQELIKATAHADAANSAKGVFLATMSHEIRTPLNVIVGTAQLLEETDCSDLQKKYVKRMLLASGSLVDLITDILDFSKIESGGISLTIMPFEVSRLMKAVGDMLIKRARDKNLEVYIEGLLDSLPPLLFDSARVQQVLTNLGNNALKFTSKGSVTLKAESKKQGENQVLIHFEVIDTGIGISEEDQKKLFQRFSQLESTKHVRQYGGVGLGLSICKKLVELMGGTIGVRSDLGRGSVFWFDLVFEKAAADPPPRNLKGQKIELRLLNPRERQIISAALKSWGAEIVSAGGNFVICDSIEEGKKGLDRKIGLIIIQDQETSELPPGAAGSLVRPFGPSELYEQLKNGLDHG